MNKLKMGCFGVSVFLALSMIMLLHLKPVLGCKILVAATSGMCSHMISGIEIAKTLSSRGNKVWVVMNEETHRLYVQGRMEIPDQIHFALFKTSLTDKDGDTFLRRYVSKQLRDERANTALQYRIEAEDREIQARVAGRKVDVFKASSFVNDDMLGNTQLIEKLKTVGFDMIIGDVVTLYQVFLSQVLKVPYINFGLTSMVPSQHDRFAFNPIHPAYVPERLSSLTDTMTFQERRKNTLLYWITGYFYYKFMLTPMDEVLQKRNIRPDANFGQLLSEAAMWIFNEDFAFEFPRPLSPHVKFVGGVLTGPSKPLNEEWQSFVDSSGDHGIVILALGTLINDELTEQQAENIASSLALLSQKVAWSYGGKLPKALGNNTKVVKWLPQNDLLGHQKTRAFISHGGLSSLHQCIYHAVPIVGIPVFGDQTDNVIRLRAKGMAVLVDIRRLTERSIYDAAVEVIYNETYKLAALHLSGIARDRVMPMTPLEEVAYWVEYAVRHGTDHLKPRSMHLSSVQYYLLDVIGVTVAMAVAICWCLTKLCCGLGRKMCQEVRIKK
ncbi:UDP-glucuronosyltransferase 2C1-like [Patiria miniata]|uniref:UDP-glycosyltransferases domain-containing protein n=1 Tax=Patiria miniata TaxID=46514 RepID=A0A913ZE36_PATMI|nr:UDP-glucuronosyltransferase 2C1-like [Patiria miniata]